MKKLTFKIVTDLQKALGNCILSDEIFQEGKL